MSGQLRCGCGCVAWYRAQSLNSITSGSSFLRFLTSGLPFASSFLLLPTPGLTWPLPPSNFGVRFGLDAVGTVRSSTSGPSINATSNSSISLAAPDPRDDEAFGPKGGGMSKSGSKSSMSSSRSTTSSTSWTGSAAFLGFAVVGGGAGSTVEEGLSLAAVVDEEASAGGLNLTNGSDLHVAPHQPLLLASSGRNKDAHPSRSTKLRLIASSLPAPSTLLPSSSCSPESWREPASSASILPPLKVTLSGVRRRNPLLTVIGGCKKI